MFTSSTITTLTRVNKSNIFNPNFSQKGQKVYGVLGRFVDATSIRSEIEGNQINRKLFREPEQLLQNRRYEGNIRLISLETWDRNRFSLGEISANPISRSREPGTSPMLCQDLCRLATSITAVSATANTIGQ